MARIILAGRLKMKLLETATSLVLLLATQALVFGTVLVA